MDIEKPLENYRDMCEKKIMQFLLVFLFEIEFFSGSPIPSFVVNNLKQIICNQLAYKKWKMCVLKSKMHQFSKLDR